MNETISNKSNDIIPRWNLDSIFSSLDSPEYKNTVQNYKELLSEIKSLINDSKIITQEEDHSFFSTWLTSFLRKYNEITAVCSTLSAYAYIIYSTDTTNTEYMNNLSFTQELYSDLDQISLSFSEVLFNNQSHLEFFYNQSPENEEYRFYINEAVEDRKHRMSPAEEKLASELNRTSGSAWSILQEQIISNLADENGKTFNELRNDSGSPDPELRKKSWEKEIELLKQNRIAIAAALNNLKGETVTLNKKRHWKEAIDRSLASSRLSKETLNALIKAIERSLPEWRKYFQAKAKQLRKTECTASTTSGTDSEPGIAFYDLFAPLKDSNDKLTNDSSSFNWTFSEAKDYIIKEYGSFSSDMAAFAKNAFEKNWIDAEIRPGKVGGAYDEDFALGHESRILSNFKGGIDDIITLAHELGHAYHFSCLKGKDPVFFSYPMTLAETASTFAETIVKQDLIKNSSGFEKISMIEKDLCDTAQTLVDILCRFYFEQIVFENRANQELNADDFCSLMAQAQERTYGNGLNSERHEYMWAVKSHYYSSDFDFYNYPYAFGQLFAAGLYQRSLKEGKEFASTYAKLLSDTGSMSCEALCKKAGFDITKEEFWESGINMYLKEIKEFISYVEAM